MSVLALFSLLILKLKMEENKHFPHAVFIFINLFYFIFFIYLFIYLFIFEDI